MYSLKKDRIIVSLTNNFKRIGMSYFVLRIKNDAELKSRVLSAILNENPTYSVKEYKEESDPSDKNYQIISLTIYEKGPYCHIKKILRELKEENEIECLTGSSSDRFL
jgi:type I restriction-modification system DNA methylase subunit